MILFWKIDDFVKSVTDKINQRREEKEKQRQEQIEVTKNTKLSETTT